MKKGYKHTDLHPTVRCKECGKPIKSRLVVIKQNKPEECYIHYVLRRCTEMGRRVPPRITNTAKKRGIHVQ